MNKRNFIKKYIKKYIRYELENTSYNKIIVNMENDNSVQETKIDNENVENNEDKSKQMLDSTSTSTKIIKEGKAEIIVQSNIFYNPVQEFNRDLSIAVLSLYAEDRHNEKISKQATTNSEPLKAGIKTPNGLKILEALSATGLRSIRYAKEIKGVDCIVANDILAKAVDAIRENILYNKVDDIVVPSHDDAIMVMYKNRKTCFDVVDLDPYGCPSMFLDGAVQSVVNGGMLVVTATDMAVLAGNSPETCYVKYGSISLKSKCCHEIALRILLQHIASHAGRYGRVITPVLSISADFYIRVFVKVSTSALACKRNLSKLGLLYQCTGCESTSLQPLGFEDKTSKLPNAPAIDKVCEHCHHKFHMGGPIWIGPLHDKEFVDRLLDKIDEEKDEELMALGTLKRIHGVLHVVSEELETPLYYALDRLMSIVRCQVPPMISFRSAILNAGYKVSYSHANKVSVKTDAPNKVLWDIVRAWEKEHPVKREKMDEKSAGLAILTSESTTTVSFTKHPDAEPKSRKQRFKRFQINPKPYWGPGIRSTTIVEENLVSMKRERNQNKRKGNELQQPQNKEPKLDS